MIIRITSDLEDSTFSSVSLKLTAVNMADSRVEVDFNVQCLADKIIINGVSECKCCLNLKRELKEIQEELSSAKLIIELLQKEDGAKEHKGYGTIEPQNLIQCNELNAGKTTENEWIEVVPSRYRRTKQVIIDPGKRQVDIENRYKVLENLQKPMETVDGLDLRKIQGVKNVCRRNLTKKDHKVILIGGSHARDCAE